MRLKKDASYVCRKPGGFTLIELLTVIAIIGLLLAILVPSLSKAKELTTRVLCGSNMHQWGIAVHMYGADNNSYFPYNGPRIPEKGIDKHGRALSWMGTLVQRFFEDYLFGLDENVGKNKNDILLCPGDVGIRAYYKLHITHPHLAFTIPAANGLLAYNFLPHHMPDPEVPFFWPPDVFDAGFSPPGNPNGSEWVRRKKIGGPYQRAPVLVDMLVDYRMPGVPPVWEAWIPDGNFYPSVSHANAKRNFEPFGGNILFETGSVRWYDFRDLGLGADLGTYHYYKPPNIE